MQTTESVLYILWRTVRVILLIEVVLIIAVILIGWLVMGWRAPSDYGLGFMCGGMLAMLFGAMSLLGTHQFTDVRYQIARSAGGESLADSIHHDQQDREQGISFLFLMAAVGALAIGLGLLLIAMFPPVPLPPPV